MKLSFLLWLSSLLPQTAADPLCLATTVYLEARDQSTLGQRAVAEVALRRQSDGRWGASTCAVVTAPHQFAPSIVSPNFRVDSLDAWTKAMLTDVRSMDAGDCLTGKRSHRRLRV